MNEFSKIVGRILEFRKKRKWEQFHKPKDMALSLMLEAGELAEHFQWRKKWDKVLEWNFNEPKIEWFKGGKLNITENCIDK